MPIPTLNATAMLDDPWLHRDLYAINHVGIDAYLVGLAAFQRGLQVAYHYEVASKSTRFRRLPVQGFRGELLSISDGQRCHFFRRTLGDLTSLEASAQAEDKTQTKRRLREAGIAVPAGIIAERHDTAAITAFTGYHPGRLFLLKPLNGSLAQGVVRNIAAADVLEQVAQHEATPLLLEEQVVGREFRVFVSVDRYVAAFERCPASVTGDGVQNIAQLWAAKQQSAAQQAHPLNIIEWPSDAVVARFLAAQGRALVDVPALGERVSVSELPSRLAGADLVDATESLPVAIQAQCVRVAQRLALPNTGLDMIITPTGKAVFLEANQSPMLVGSVLPVGQPGHGNRVAESVVDTYFPGSVSSPRFPHASFDFSTLCQLLRTGVASSFTLPVLGPGWVHRRMEVTDTPNQSAAVAVRTAQYRLGIHVRQRPLAAGGLWLDVLAPQARFEAFAKAVGGHEVPLTSHLTVAE